MNTKIFTLLAAVIFTCSFATAALAQETVILPNPLTTPKGQNPNIGQSTQTIIAQHVIGRVIKVALGIVGSVALVMFIYGGYIWLTSAGEPGRIKKGRDTFMWAAVGLLVIFSGALLVQKIIDALQRGA